MDAAPASVDEALASPGTPLELTLRQDMEQRFGHDFSRVRVHSGAAAEQSAQDVNAHAYTVGQDIVFDAGRFALGTHDGRRLIAHELTHVVQQAGADRIYADRGNEKRGLSGLSPHVPELGHVAQQGTGNPVGAALLQRQVRPGRGRKGKTEHTGVLSAPSWVNMTPISYGTVEVRTGEEIELQSGTKIPNMIALEYTGLWSKDSKWLQFVWFEEFGTAPNGQVVVNAGQTIPAECGTQSFTTVAASPKWGVDSGCDDPFYEAGGTNIRTSGSTTIFDDPGGLENSIAMELANRWFDKYASISSVTWTAHFETYLIQGDRATYVVSWQASATFTHDVSKGKTEVGALGYTVHASGPQEELPRDRKTLLDKKYPKFKHVK